MTTADRDPTDVVTYVSGLEGRREVASKYGTTPATAAADFLPIRQFAEHIERAERVASYPTYPVWKRPFRCWALRLIAPDGTVESERYRNGLMRREAERDAASWNALPLRPGYRVEVHRA